MSESALVQIGVVREMLADEFPDISISKIRYLEDQGLLAPKRKASGYRLYSHDDIHRLRTILRLQRDEFLPLRVIRAEFARGDMECCPLCGHARRSTGPQSLAA